MSNTDFLHAGKYHLKKYHEIPQNAIEFLDSISWGNEGAVYENLKIRAHILLLHNPTLYAIQDSDQIMGTAMFSNTEILVNSRPYNCFYIKYFASSPKLRGKGITTKISQQVMKLVKDETIEKCIFFASVETANKRSYKVVESSGYSEIGKVRTLGFSRFFPRKKNIEQVTDDGVKKEVLALLKALYNKHVLVQFNSIFMKDNFYIIRDQGRIVAGCQYHRGHWKINKMKGFLGKILIRTLPHIPLLRKMFNPRSFEFLVFEGIYVEKGFEKKLFDIFETLLAKEELMSAMIWMGENCPVADMIKNKGRLGILNKVVSTSTVSILASFNKMSDDEQRVLFDNPIYASGFDYT